MSQFRNDLQTEEAGKQMLLPLLETIAVPGSVLWTNDAENSERWQRDFGDVIYTRKGMNRHVVAEIKTERVWTGNFFFEKWSNMNWNFKRAGWMYTQSFDVLIYIFLDQKIIFFIPGKGLHSWFTDDTKIYRFRGKEKICRFNDVTVGKSLNGLQKNETRGMLVPCDLILREIAGTIAYVRADDMSWFVADESQMPEPRKRETA